MESGCWLVLVPHAPEPLARQAIVLLRRGQLPQALAKAVLAAAQGPESAEAWNPLGSINHALGELEQAHTHYAKVLEYNESHVEARIARARVALDLNKLDSAADDLAYLLTHYSLEPRAAFLQSVLLTRHGDEKGAKAAVSEAVQLLAHLSPVQQAQETSLLDRGSIANFNLNAHEQAEQFLTRYLQKRRTILERGASLPRSNLR
jgi:tetratricopeptide (TPR) repeat protein